MAGVIGLSVIAFAVIAGITGYARAIGLETAERRYKQRRAALIGSQGAADEGDDNPFKDS